MAGVLSRKTIVGVKAEVTPGTYITPTSTDLLRVVEVPIPAPAIDVADRPLITGQLGELKPIKSMRHGTIPLKTELRGGGVTAGTTKRPENGELLKNAFGKEHVGVNTTTVSGSTSAQLKLLTSAISISRIGSPILLSGIVRVITAQSGLYATLNQGLGAVPASGVAVKVGRTYAPGSDDTDYNYLSITLFQDAATSGPAFKGIGCKTSSLAFSGFEVGQIPKLEHTLEVMDHSEALATVPAGASFNSQLPPVVMNGYVSRADAQLAIDTMEFKLENTIEQEKDVNASSGIVDQFVTKRKVTGKINPKLAQADVALQDAWRNNDSFELFTVVGQKNSSGQFQHGTCAVLYMPNVVFTNGGREDKNGLMRHALEFMAHVDTGDDEVYLGIL